MAPSILKIIFCQFTLFGVINCCLLYVFAFEGSYGKKVSCNNVLQDVLNEEISIGIS